MQHPFLRLSSFLVAFAMGLPSIFAQQPPSANTNNLVVIIPSELRPSESDLFSQAVSLQSQKQYARAVQAFSDLLRFYPETENGSETLHRIAECYRALGRFPDALSALKLNREKYPNGSWLESGYLLEGEMLAADEKWSEAIPSLEKASKSSNLTVKIRALYLATLGRENLKELSKARPQLEQLVAIASNNPYLDYARLKLGAVEADAGNSKQALALFKEVLSKTSDPAIRSEAAVRSGNLSYSLKNYRDALTNFELVHRLEAPPFWKKLAALGLLQTNFAVLDFQGVIDIYDEYKLQFPPESRTQVTFLTAEAHRLLKKEPEAIVLYEFIVKNYPKDPMAEPSAWARLLLLQSGDKDKFLKEIDAFIQQFPTSSRIPLAKLLKADTLYDKGNYESSSKLYAEVSDQPPVRALDSKIRAAMSFRWAHAMMMRKQYNDAIPLFSGFLDQFHKHDLTANALWLLAQCAIEAKQSQVARSALDRLIKEFPAFNQREEAIWQNILLCINDKQFSLALPLLEELLKAFPQSPHSADAHYWLATIQTQSKKLPDARIHWQKARELKPATYTEIATQQLIRNTLETQDIPGLVSEIKIYDTWRTSHPKAPLVSPDIFEWLAQKLDQGKDPASAEAYYRRVIAESKASDQLQRAQLGLSMLMSKLEKWGAAVREWTTYRVSFPSESNRNAVLEQLSKACIGAADFDQATKLAEQILEQNPEGEYNARGRMLLGEIAFSQRRYGDAAKIFSAVALLIDDPVITPLAQARATEAKKRIGDNRNLPQ